ncbi:zinc finger MYM-type protein 1-like, partial [Aphis craccivora]
AVGVGEIMKSSEQEQECNDDISFYVGKTLSSDKKVLALNKLWIPMPGYNFPKTGKRNLKFQYIWLLHVGKGNHQVLGKLVFEKFDNWKKALGVKGFFKTHEATEYHKTCQYKYDTFFAVKNNQVESVEVQVNNNLKKEIQENRNRIIPIIKTVLFCGKRGIALRGHRDEGMIDIEDDKMHNDGHFRQLLRFRVDAGDKDLENHLMTCAKNGMYTSWRIQNEILTTCNILILQHLVKNINAAKSFTILSDETSDISKKEQLTLCIRYVNSGKKKLREDFLQFVEVKNMSGKALADTILQNLQSLGIETKYIVGQGYDGAAAMSGMFNGTQSHIRKKYPMALY